MLRSRTDRLADVAEENIDLDARLADTCGRPDWVAAVRRQVMRVLEEDADAVWPEDLAANAAAMTSTASEGTANEAVGDEADGGERPAKVSRSPAEPDFLLTVLYDPALFWQAIGW